MACQSALLNPSFLIGPRHLIWAWHALPRAVPQSGHRLEGQGLQRLWRYTEMPSVRFGRLHAHCRKFSAHAKPSVKSRCVALDPSSPQAVTDQVARTSTDGVVVGNSGV